MKLILMANSISKVLMLFLTFTFCITSFSQSGNKKKTLDSLLTHKWAVVVSSEEENMKTSNNKMLLVDASPAELPHTIDFFSNGTLSVGSKKGTWKTIRGKDKLQIIIDGKSTTYRVEKLQNQKVKLHELRGQKKRFY